MFGSSAESIFKVYEKAQQSNPNVVKKRIAMIEKNQKEVTSSKFMVTPTAVTKKSSETTTKPKAEVENQNVTETSKEVGLPETGEDKTNLITTGIVLASIAATITALGSFINKKN